MPPPPQPPGRPGYQGTRLESAEEARQAVQSRRSAGEQPLVLTPASSAPIPVAPAPAPPADDTAPFRPTHRAPMAMLCILDDGKDDGEWLRLRADQVVIGRSDGDIRIPHDGMMSGRHAMLARRLQNDQYRWFISDLGSTNGTFVRVGDSLLRNNQELLIGSRRFRFDSAAQGAALMAEAEVAAASDSTRGWQAVSPTQLIPSIVELGPSGEGQRHFLNKADNWIGRDARACAVVLTGDPFVSPLHARIYKDQQSRWKIENLKSLNGTWLRFEEVPCGPTCQFQLGEQRFVLRVI